MDRVRVLTINIWNRSGPWQHRRGLLENGIAELDCDVIGLQEVLHRERLGQDGAEAGNAQLPSQARDLADAIGKSLGKPMFLAFGPAFHYENGEAFGNAVLSRYPIEDSEVLQLDGGDSRSVLGCRIRLPAGSLPFFVTHLSWKFDEGYLRESQVRQIADFERAFRHDSDLPSVLVGDLNAQPDATEIRFLRGLHSLGGVSTHFTDCFERSGDGAGFTFDPPNNPHAALTYEMPRRIDYVFVKGPTERGQGMPLGARVVLDEVVEVDGQRVMPSDHYGVFAEIGV